jgi:hypothetical protein
LTFFFSSHQAVLLSGNGETRRQGHGTSGPGCCGCRYVKSTIQTSSTATSAPHFLDELTHRCAPSMSVQNHPLYLPPMNLLIALGLKLHSLRDHMVADKCKGSMVSPAQQHIAACILKLAFWLWKNPIPLEGHGPRIVFSQV